LFGGDGGIRKLTEGKAKDALEGCYFSTHVSSKIRTCCSKFYKKYKEKYNMMPDAMSFLAYDAGLILFDAIKRAGSTEADKIREELAKTKDFKGVTGKITINSMRNAVKPAVILEIKGGHFKFKEIVSP
jgi:branched-chain amino acid transport system substrate-binding protein